MTDMSASGSSAGTPLHYELIVIGAGPAGMSAALASARHGLRTLLIDEQQAVGGQIYRNITRTDAQRERILGADYSDGGKLAEQVRQQVAAGRVDYWPGAAVWQVAADKTIHVLREGKTQALHGEAIIVATGAMERPFPVHGWTLPGVMAAGAGQVLLKDARLVPSTPVVLAGCGPLLYLMAVQYLRAGVPIKALLDTSPATVDPRLVLRHASGLLAGWKYVAKGLRMLREIKASGVPFFQDVRQLRMEGQDHLEGVSFVCGDKAQTLACEVCLLHQGVVPNTQISWSLRAEHRWDDAQLCWVPVCDDCGQSSVPGIYVAGDSAAIGGAQVAALQGELTALGVLRQLRPDGVAARDADAQRLRRQIRRHLAIRPFLDRLYRPRDEHRIPADEVTVCRCEEVTAGSIRALVKLGCVGPNQVKSFNRSGMGPCQGRMCGLTVTEVIAQASGLPPQQVGYYRIRPPIKALTLGQLTQHVS